MSSTLCGFLGWGCFQARNVVLSGLIYFEIDLACKCIQLILGGFLAIHHLLKVDGYGCIQSTSISLTDFLFNYHLPILAMVIYEQYVKCWGLSFVIGLVGIKALLCNTHLRYYCQCPSLSSLLRGRYRSKAKTWVLHWVFVRLLPHKSYTSVYPFLNLEKWAV